MTQIPHHRAPGVMGELCPRTIPSGAIQRGGKTGKGNPYQAPQGVDRLGSR
jgi:hypothetical protein